MAVILSVAASTALSSAHVCLRKHYRASDILAPRRAPFVAARQVCHHPLPLPPPASPLLPPHLPASFLQSTAAAATPPTRQSRRHATHVVAAVPETAQQSDYRGRAPKDIRVLVVGPTGEAAAAGGMSIIQDFKVGALLGP